MRLWRSVTACAKVTLFLLNLWVLCVIMVVALGQWRVFDADISLPVYDNGHLGAPRKTLDTAEAAGKRPGLDPVKKSEGIKETKLQAPPTLTPIQREVAERVSTMRQSCQRLRLHQQDIATVPDHRLSMMMVDRERKLLFCQIPGVALNDWRRMFIYLTGKVNVSSHLKISAYDAHSKYGGLVRKLTDFKPGERRQIVNDSLKIVFVRDPLERLVSTYQNKFVARYSKYFHSTFGRKIIEKYRRNASKKALAEGSDVRFDEFVRFVLDAEHHSDSLMNEHWERYYRQCQPCLFSYDYVGKFETLVEDVTEVLTRAGVLNKLHAPYVADTFRNSEKTLKQLFQTVNPADLKRLWKIYYPDYNLFSYPYPEVLRSLLQPRFNDY